MNDVMQKKIHGLVEKYRAEKESGKLKKYTEEETKKGFIEPLFTALGWDITDKNEVSAEENISSKRVDYGFYLDERVQFYLEAKAAKENIEDSKWADQAVKYSWNKGVTWAVLTNFERLIVFNAQDIERSLADKELFDIAFEDYEKDERLLLLSKDAFAKNELDAYAEKIGKKFKRVPITSQLYEDLNEARELLTDALAGWNDELKKKPDLLDEGVQKLLDRLIFIRVAEDRGVEPETLTPLVRAWDASKNKNEVPLYQWMINKFRELDETYNSNLFQEHPFEKWQEYGGATEKAIELLRGKKGYYEYDFKVMPADVLGTVYEQYLGHRLSKSKKGLALDKDAGKRKEQGIYYTPAFIVDYIVKNALSPILDHCKTIDDLHKIKVLDPACGSGSFLIKALEVLYEKYREFGQPEGETTKLVILTHNLYGVDLDEQAVEIARLNLLINALDERRKLPYLTDHIKCGNSLISGTDTELKKYFGSNFDEKRRFNWEEEFPEVFKQGGFDIVIGNPPYISLSGRQSADIDEDERRYLHEKYESIQGWPTLHSAFVERSIKLLSKRMLSFIVPDQVGHLEGYGHLRKFILDNAGLTKVKYWGEDVFADATTPSITFVADKEYKGATSIYKINDEKVEVLLSGQKTWTAGSSLIDKLREKTESLGDLVADLGVHTGNVSQEIIKPIDAKSKDCVPVLEGKNISRYFCEKPEKCLLINYKVKEGEYFTIRPKDRYKKATFVVRQTASLPIVGPKRFTDYFRNSLLALYPPQDKREIEYLVGILNSKLMRFIYQNTVQESGQKAFPQVKIKSLRELPIRSIDFSKSKEKTTHDEVVKLAREMLELNEKLSSIEENSNQWEQLKAEIEKTDKKIDDEIYKLYGLTAQEISTVEQSLAKS
ncbi:MAG: N-6 DNA methylase [Candidatus Sungbacteria bacterium]|uniref:site-specific DNA-methyltransferase (adenine-specific) n=1 Tax=Candidatus Sungiibacteriota bacterium TaxID=2750080 RepID=A0A9D6LNP2_9BACT|nr:N-6 DNA methylase [Candidatus Sungbacteria bacterium]